MMNRGVMDRQMFRNGGGVKMQQGGNPALEAEVNAATEAFIKVMGRPPESLEELRAFAEGA